MNEEHCKCDKCGDTASTEPDTLCGRDFGEESGVINHFCEGVYREVKRVS